LGAGRLALADPPAPACRRRVDDFCKRIPDVGPAADRLKGDQDFALISPITGQTESDLPQSLTLAAAKRGNLRVTAADCVMPALAPPVAPAPDVSSVGVGPGPEQTRER